MHTLEFNKQDLNLHKIINHKSHIINRSYIPPALSPVPLLTRLKILASIFPKR